MLTQCSKCTMEWQRPANQQHTSAPFVCKVCRCEDCQIVFDQECDCGEGHAERSTINAKICKACQGIRERVELLDPELKRIRESEFLIEDPLY